MASLKKVRRKFKRLRQMPMRDQLMIAEAWVTLAWFDLAVSLLPYDWWRSQLLDRPGTNKAKQTVPPRCVVTSVNLAAKNHLRRMNCLRQTLTLRSMLARRGYPSSMRFGAQQRLGKLSAHAWLECQGVILNDSARVANRYHPLKRRP